MEKGIWGRSSKEERLELIENAWHANARTMGQMAAYIDVTMSRKAIAGMFHRNRDALKDKGVVLDGVRSYTPVKADKSKNKEKQRTKTTKRVSNFANNAVFAATDFKKAEERRRKEEDARAPIVEEAMSFQPRNPQPMSEAEGCMWPVSGGCGVQLFCNEPTDRLKRYCSVHARL